MRLWTVNEFYVYYVQTTVGKEKLSRLSFTMQKSLMLIATFHRKYLHMPLECI